MNTPTSFPAGVFRVSRSIGSLFVRRTSNRVEVDRIRRRLLRVCR